MAMKAGNQGKRNENKESFVDNFEILPFVGVLAEFWGKGLPCHMC